MAILMPYCSLDEEYSTLASQISRLATETGGAPLSFDTQAVSNQYQYLFLLNKKNNNLHVKISVYFILFMRRFNMISYTYVL